MGLLKNVVDFFIPEEKRSPAEKPGRNALCWCGSGKKYKKCHLHEDEKKLKNYAVCGKT